MSESEVIVCPRQSEISMYCDERGLVLTDADDGEAVSINWPNVRPLITAMQAALDEHESGK